jgi:hypothetical protein
MGRTLAGCSVLWSRRGNGDAARADGWHALSLPSLGPAAPSEVLRPAGVNPTGASHEENSDYPLPGCARCSACSVAQDHDGDRPGVARTAADTVSRPSPPPTQAQ